MYRSVQAVLRSWGLLCSLVLLLTACGGDLYPGDPARALQTARTGSLQHLSESARTFPRSGPLPQRQMGSVAPTALAMPKDSALQYLGERTIDGVSIDQLFNWAERFYPQLFPETADTARSAPYTYRYYKTTDTYLGVDDQNRVWLLGATATAGQLVLVGDMRSFVPEVARSALTVYRMAGAIFLDAQDFLPARGIDGEFAWRVKSAPATWPGLFYSDQKGRIGLYPSGSGGVLAGSYLFELQQQLQDGRQSSVQVDVRVCCDRASTLDDIESFVPRLQRWSAYEIERQFVRLTDRSFESVLRFANTYGLSAPDLDMLLGQPLGTVYDQLLKVDWSTFTGNEPSGGAVLQGARYAVENAVVVPGNLSQVSYPQDYQRITRAESPQNPLCAYNAESTIFRASAVNGHALPALAPQKMAQPFELMADFKDVWGRLSPQYQSGCAGDFKAVFLASLSDVQRKGVTHITLRPWTVFDGSSANAWRVLNPGELGLISDAEFEWMVKQAAARGIKVTWANQIQMAYKDSARNQLFGSFELNPDRAVQTFRALETFLLERGAYLQRIGVHAVMLPSAWYWANLRDAMDKPSYLDWTQRLIAALRKNFTGKIYFDFDSDIAAEKSLTAAIDMFAYSPQANFPVSDLSRLSVEFLLRHFQDNFVNARALVPEGKLMLYLNAGSRRDFFHSGYLEETFCTAGYGLDSGPYSQRCVQRDKVADFGLQAIYHEAAFRFAAGLTGVRIPLVSYQYWWFAQNPLAGTAFPDLSTSVRGKPSEYIIDRWYRAQR